MFEKKSTVIYELFNNILSGVPMVIAINLSNNDFASSLEKLSSVSFVVLLGITYLIGTIIHAASFIFQRIISRKIHPIKDKSKKHIALRKNDIENWYYIEKWYVLSNSYLSLSLSLVLSLILLLNSKVSFSPILIFGVIISVILLVIQALKYSEWAKKDLNNSYQNIINDESST